MRDYIFKVQIEVRDYELDSEGIVNNANYLHYLEHTRHAFVMSRGYSFGQMSADGIIPVVNRIEVDYKSALRSGDVMDSCLWVERKGVRYLFHQDIYNKVSGQLVVSAIVSIVALVNGQLSRGDELWQKLGMDHE
ncbi:MAG: acyl-CoA thioesterase [Muribaculaceae bacterium]|nr:acyl-CoA thioesterase [Muribaculaceae bacterium]